MLQALLALTAAALFTGAAIYISLAEHPARLGLADSAALAQWQPSYKRAVPMQAGLALASTLLAFWAWRALGNPRFLVGALLIFAVIPFTLLVIKPTNDRLQATSPEAVGPKTRALLRRWGRLHMVRSLIGTAAAATFLYGLAAAPDRSVPGCGTFIGCG